MFFSCYFAEVFMVAKSFRVQFFMTSANRDILTVSLCICIPFTSFCLIGVARNFRTMLNRSVDSGHPCHVPNFRWNGFNLFPLSMMLTVGLSYIAFIMLTYVPSTPIFLRVFFMKLCWIFSKAFSSSNEVIRFCVFASVNVFYYI
jgi:hypothetical protein